MSHEHSLRALAVCIVLAGVLAGAQLSASQAAVRQTGGVDGFLAAIQHYSDVQKKAAETVPALKETDTPQQIAEREKLLAQAIVKGRPDARAGDIFGPARRAILEIASRNWKRRSAAERKDIMGELPGVVLPKVNTVYPTTYPLLTFPPSLLDELPKLPEELEYRFVGPHLILRDVKANLIVDVLPHALPFGTGGAQGGKS